VRRPTRAIDLETRGFLRNVGWLVAGFALVMLALDAFIRWAGMLWMDVPLLAIGGGFLYYAWRAPAKDGA
jgi:hypothetical protein